MAQHDMVLDNGPGLAVRTDMNAAVQALVSNSSGPVEPTVKYAGQLWLDTSVTPNGLLRQRNLANNGWIALPITTTNLGQDIHAAVNKVTPADADEFIIADSAAAWLQKRLSWANLKATMRTYLNAYFQPILTGVAGIEIGDALTGDRNSYVDFHSDDTNADYSARIIRNIGVNGSLDIVNQGTGGIRIAGQYPVLGAPQHTIATAAEYQANTANRVPSVAALWAGAAPETITYAASMTMNLATFIDSRVIMTGNCTVPAVSNVKNGQKGIMWFLASGAARTLTVSLPKLKDVEPSPYAIPTSNWVGLAYTCFEGSCFVTNVMRYP